MLMATVNTVLGPVDASQIGGTMSHVHLTINILCWFREPDSGVQRGISEQKISLQNLGFVRRNAMLVKDNLVQDNLDLAIREAAEYKFAGGQTLINVDLPGMGRDPLALQKIARASADDAQRNLGPGSFKLRLRADGIYAFLLVAQPLCVTGAVGSPVNPVAIK
jgi:predicted metal-dependent phosphotriesterase family hydrolase